MAEHEDYDAEVDDFEAAGEIGAKVIEMADRVKVVHAACPGSQAKWFFTIDDQRFEVTVKVAPDRSDAGDAAV